MYKRFIKPILFLYGPEEAHRMAFRLIKSFLKVPIMQFFCRYCYRVTNKKLQRKLFGITFPNPVGLAAGFDKNARLVDELASFGFGYIEVGTVTPLMQMGNPQPRLFRLAKDKALINRMGFNNDGAATIKQRLKKSNKNSIVGVNIGKNKNTPNESAVLDYKLCFESCHDVADYIAINVSSPNTPGLRDMQHKAHLKVLLQEIMTLNNCKPRPKPILLKIAPDLTYAQLDDIIEVVNKTGTAGVIATNTTVKRNNLTTETQEVKKIGTGGLSGQPLRELSTSVIRYLSTKSKQAFPIIAAGGIMSAEDAIEKLEAGAALVQIYTGFIYEGPSLIKRINKAILKK